MDRMPPRKLVELFFFVSVLNLVIFLTTAVLHEFGHVVLGILEGCREISIVLFDLSTHATYTAMDCPTPPAPASVYASSFIFVLPIAILLSALTDFREHYMGAIIIGGNFLGATADLAAYTTDPVTIYAFTLGGLALILVGEDRLVRESLRHIITETDDAEQLEEGGGGP